tara:strand:+ start:192 stop:665 length:474 start_codon:yes stop_codon:yes gene_type:complete
MSFQKENNYINSSKELLEHVYEGRKLLAIILRTSFKKEGIDFFTPPDFSQQLGYMNRPKGYKIQPHVHQKIERTIQYTQEVLFIKKGLLRVDFYKNDKTYLNSKLLNQGDVILLSSGGHGFEMLEDTEIIEVKQGPFAGNIDKTRFEFVSENELDIN